MTVVVNADDFGQSVGINRGVVRAHQEGIVTSASLMVRHGAASDAAHIAQSFPRLSVGLHLDLGEWAVLDGEWRALYRVVDLEDPEHVRTEVRRQVALFRELLGCDPTHLDSHQHVHLRETVRRAAQEVADELRVPLRRCSSVVSYCGDFYGQTASGESMPEWISSSRLLSILAGLAPGVHELACHPAWTAAIDAELPVTMYREERLRETDALCDPAVRRAVAAPGLRLASFSDLLTERSSTASVGADTAT